LAVGSVTYGRRVLNQLLLQSCPDDVFLVFAMKLRLKPGTERTTHKKKFTSLLHLLCERFVHGRNVWVSDTTKPVDGVSATSSLMLSSRTWKPQRGRCIEQVETEIPDRPEEGMTFHHFDKIWYFFSLYVFPF